MLPFVYVNVDIHVHFIPLLMSALYNYTACSLLTYLLTYSMEQSPS